MYDTRTLGCHVAFTLTYAQWCQKLTFTVAKTTYIWFSVTCPATLESTGISNPCLPTLANAARVRWGSSNATMLCHAILCQVLPCLARVNIIQSTWSQFTILSKNVARPAVLEPEHFFDITTEKSISSWIQLRNSIKKVVIGLLFTPAASLWLPCL